LFLHLNESCLAKRAKLISLQNQPSLPYFLWRIESLNLAYPKQVLFDCLNEVPSPITSTEGTSATVLARKGSHSVWRHPYYHICIIQSGKDSHDAKPYQVKTLNMVIAQGS
jgi:hypothetical protein